MLWDTNLYHDKHRFVAEYGKALLEYVPEDENQVILDLGCGTGALTCELLKKSKNTIGIDYSDDMIKKAALLYPDISFQVMDACNLQWENHFDIIFSNAVFHWISDQDALLNSIYKALKPHGQLICEFGAYNNVALILKAYASAVEKLGYTFVNYFFYPTTEDYNNRLVNTGFTVKRIMDFDRPTPLVDGEFGLRNWIKQFLAKDLFTYSKIEQEEILENVENTLRPHLWNGSKWIADYRRIQVVACKQ